MTETEWLAASNPTSMLKFLNGKVSDRKLRLLGCACCRRIWTILPGYPTRLIVDAVERFVEGLESPVVIGRLRKQSCRADTWYLHGYNLAVRKASPQSTDAVLLGAARLFAFEDGWGIREEKRQAESVAQVAILHCVAGNPFRPVTFSPSWRTDTAVVLARQMYESRDLSAMPILADALQDAGCDGDDILNHCRGNGPHVRGCWVVDLVLGKE